MISHLIKDAFGKGEDALKFQCPGCDIFHVVPVTGPRAWGWNQSTERPTLTPSIRIGYVKEPPLDPVTNDFKRGTYGQYLKGPDGRLLGAKDMVCHSFVTDGQIQYCSDSTHDLAGKTVPLPELS